MFTSVLVLEVVFITFQGNFQQCASEIVNHLQPDRTVLSYHPSVKLCSSGSGKSGCNDVCINLYITHVMIV